MRSTKNRKGHLGSPPKNIRTTPQGAEKLERLRNSRSYERLAEDSGISRDKIYRFCTGTGNSPIRYKNYLELCDYFDVNWEDVGASADDEKELNDECNAEACIHNLPFVLDKLIAREQDIEMVAQMLLQNVDKPATLVLTGMPGVGKSALALQYAWENLAVYSGGICRVEAREGDIAAQIVRFACSQLDLGPPAHLDFLGQLFYCWKHWPDDPSPVLILLDDVDNYAAIKDFFPTFTSRFRFLLTSRQQMERSIPQFPVSLPNAADGLAIMGSILGDDPRWEAEVATLQALAKWLGYLPLTLHLVANYLALDETVTVAEVYEDLQRSSLDHPVLNEADGASIVRRGTKAAFDLSWERLPEDGQRLGVLLSLFAPAPLSWDLVATAADGVIADTALRPARFSLVRTHLVQLLDGNTYQLHRLIREFFRSKQTVIDPEGNYPCRVVQTVIALARTLPEKPERGDLKAFIPLLPQVEETVENFGTYLPTDAITGLFRSLVRFYREVGGFRQGLVWAERGLVSVEATFGSQHRNTALLCQDAASMVCLLQDPQMLPTAKNRLQQAMEIERELAGDDSLEVATLNLLWSVIYRLENNMPTAIEYARKALAVREERLGVKNLDTSEARMTLASSLFRTQQTDLEMLEPMVFGIVEVRRRSLPANHPDLAESLDLLAKIYERQRRTDESEPLFREALAISEVTLGHDHVQTALGCHNLAKALADLNHPTDSIPLYQQALTVFSAQKMLRPQGRCHHNLGKSYLALGEKESAKEHLHQAVNLYKECKLSTDDRFWLEIAEDLQRL